MTQPMEVTTVFITRYVADHDEMAQWYARFLGRRWDSEPVPNCREWHLGREVFFQVIHAPDRAGQTSFAFGARDLASEGRRLAEVGLEPAPPGDVTGFDDLQWMPVTDPEGVETGVLNQSGVREG